MQPETMIDLDRYPILNDDGRSRITAKARADLKESGSAVLPGFLRPEAVEAMAAEASALIPMAHRRDQMLGAYAMAPDPEMDADHPVRRTSLYRMGIIAADRLNPDGPVLGVYEWDHLTDLLSEILELPKLYRVTDPLLRCALSVLSEGDTHGWHFDENAFVVSLLIQKAQSGGAFEFVPALRDEKNENFDEVRAVMDGSSSRVHRLEAEPGTLALFQGNRALHRVTEVKGNRPRITALFSYDENANMEFDAKTRINAFGRAA